MAFVNSISWLFCLVLTTSYVSYHATTSKTKTTQQFNDDLSLITVYRERVEKRLQEFRNNNSTCTKDYNLLGADRIFQDYSFWNNEMRIVNNVANYITSMWRYKNAMNRSVIENEASMYTLAKTVALSSEHIYSSVVCFDAFKFQGKRQFCPYAFKNKTRTNYTTIVRDLGRVNDYITAPVTEKETGFIWWHVGRNSLVNKTIKDDIEYNDIDLDKSDTRNVSSNGKYFNINTKYVPVNAGKWTTPYYDCFGGQTWMFTYLEPFYDQKNNFLGLVGFDIELDSIEVNECDAPITAQAEKSEAESESGRRTVQFYGAHACRNVTTKCVHVHGGGFNEGNYHCVCRKGYYFPIANAKKKYFNGREVLAAKKAKHNYSLYDCLPCREGCEECVDDTPCMYQRNMTLRTVFLVINEIIKAMAIALGVFVFIFKDSKIIKASSPVFMEIIAFGVVLMYFEITLGYFEDSVMLCIARSWLFHTGFILAFGSLLLKTWRIAVIFRLRTAKMIELTDGTLLKYLMLMLVAITCYLMIWTWTKTPQFEVQRTTAGYKYRRCVRGWFSNAIGIGELLLLLWGVWLCLRVRNAPSAYNESKYIAWCIYNTVFIMILVGLLRIVLDNFHNPDVSYVVDFLSTHVVATIMLVLLFISKIYLWQKFRKDMHRTTRANSATSTTATDLRKSPFHLNRLVDGTLVCETEEDKTVSGLESENLQLREEIRNLSAKLAVFENKLARESKRKGSSPEDEFKIHNNDFQIIAPDSETESSRDGNGFSDKRRRKRSAAAESTASNGSVFTREERGGSLLDDIKNAGKQDHFLAVPKQNSLSEEDETLTVVSNISNGST